MKRIRNLVCIWIALLSVTALAQNNGNPNLARVAHASASESYSQDLTPDKAIDGKDTTRWSGISGHNSGVWFELDWEKPRAIRQVVIKQYDRYSEEWDLQIWDAENSAWKTIRHFGTKGSRLPKNVLADIDQVFTTKLRIANITNGPSFNEVEVYATQNDYPPLIEVASDLNGNYVGMLTNAFGSDPSRPQDVLITGANGKGPWSETVRSDEHGIFIAPMHPGSTDPVTIRTSEGTRKTIDPRDFQLGLTPMSSDQPKTELGGSWKFEPDPTDQFWKPDFDDSQWGNISVPSHWEMAGFRSKTGVGGYRRTFTPPSGKGRLKLRFDGVYSGAEVYLNGKKVAYHEGGFTPFEVDISDNVRSGSNHLALRVTEHTKVSDDLDKMSLYADFPLGGIMRRAYLFRVPDTHIARYTQDSKFNPDGTVNVNLNVFGVDEGHDKGLDCQVQADLIDSHGRTVQSSAEPMRIPGDSSRQGQTSLTMKVADPKPWTAETPNLYTLRIALSSTGKTLHTLEQKIGLRQTTIRGSQILINGSPVKIHGTCHHDSDPLRGRAVTADQERLDLQLVKEANLNSVRTSHYPPLPELIDFADQLGVYVEDEADFCWVGVADDLRYAPRILQLTAEMVARDRNHPSVFIWSLCNESSWGFDYDRSHEWVLKNDPSRPTSAATSAWTEIATFHNPISIARMDEVEKLDKPMLVDEAWCIYQGIFQDVNEMWVDPGIRDYYVEPLGQIYRKFMDDKVTQGSQIWCWQDDLFCVPGRGLEYGRGTTKSHFIDNDYALPGRGIVGDAPWGVVDGWRRRKPEFWITKKLNSPVKIEEGQRPLPVPGQPLEFKVENQYDFLNLSALHITYSLNGETGACSIDCPPHSVGVLRVAPKAKLHAGDVLALRFATQTGKLVDDYKFPVGKKHEDEPSLPRPTPLTIENFVNLATDAGLEIQGSDFDIAFDTQGGYLRRFVSKGIPVMLGLPQLHVLAANQPMEPMVKPDDWKLKDFKEERDSSAEKLTFVGSYPDFSGQYDLTIYADGTLTIKSAFTYTGPNRFVRETGLAFDVPKTLDTIHWERDAEWSVYPDDHIGRPVGTARAFAAHAESVPPQWEYSQDNSPMGSNDFRSTKRHISSAWVGSSGNPKILIVPTARPALRAMVATDRIVVHVNDWYGGTNVGWGEWISNYGRGKLLKAGDVLKSELTLKF